MGKSYHQRNSIKCIEYLRVKYTHKMITGTTNKNLEDAMKTINDKEVSKIIEEKERKRAPKS